MGNMFEDILHVITDRGNSLKAKIKKYGSGKNAKPYEEELRSLENQLKAPLLAMQEKARGIAIALGLKNEDELFNLNTKDFAFKVRYLKAKHDAALCDDTKVIEPGDYIVYVLRYGTPLLAIAKCNNIRDDGLIVTDSGRRLSKSQCFPYGTPIEAMLSLTANTTSYLPSHNELENDVSKLIELGVEIKGKEYQLHMKSKPIWMVCLKTGQSLLSYYVPLDEAIVALNTIVKTGAAEYSDLCISYDASGAIRYINGDVKNTETKENE